MDGDKTSYLSSLRNAPITSGRCGALTNAGDEEEMNCPICAVELTMSERSGVEIDYCPKCRGVWLDRGELDKIVERSSMEDSSGGAESRYESRRHQSGVEGHEPFKKKRRESFLGDLFDFG